MIVIKGVMFFLSVRGAEFCKSCNLLGSSSRWNFSIQFPRTRVVLSQDLGLVFVRKKLETLFPVLGRSVLGKKCALCLRPRAVLKALGTIFPNKDVPAGE